MSASTLLISLGGNLKYVKIEGKLPVEIDGRFKFLVFYCPLSFVEQLSRWKMPRESVYLCKLF